MVKLFSTSTVNRANGNYLLFTVKALPTHIVQYQSLTETHNQNFYSSKNGTHNQNTLMENSSGKGEYT